MHGLTWGPQTAVAVRAPQCAAVQRVCAGRGACARRVSHHAGQEGQEGRKERVEAARLVAGYATYAILCAVLCACIDVLCNRVLSDTQGLRGSGWGIPVIRMQTLWAVLGKAPLGVCYPHC